LLTPSSRIASCMPTVAADSKSLTRCRSTPRNSSSTTGVQSGGKASVGTEIAAAERLLHGKSELGRAHLVRWYPASYLNVIQNGPRWACAILFSIVVATTLRVGRGSESRSGKTHEKGAGCNFRGVAFWAVAAGLAVVGIDTGGSIGSV